MQWTEKNPQRVGNYSPEVWCESKTKVNILGCIAKPKVLWIKSCAGLFFCKYLYWGLSMLAHRVGVETESLFWLQYKLEHTGQTPDAGDGQSPYTVVHGSSWCKVSSTPEMCGVYNCNNRDSSLQCTAGHIQWLWLYPKHLYSLWHWNILTFRTVSYLE